jgi:acetyl-CoA synthetase
MKQISSANEYKALHEVALNSPEKHWSTVADSFLWKQRWNKVQSGELGEATLEWFSGAKLNITENCLDRHLSHSPDKAALIFEPNDPSSKTRTYTYRELHAEVCQAANMLKGLGVKKGDAVCFYMSQIPELMIGVLACARIGAVHSVVFAGFSAKSLSDRINNCAAKVLITNDEGLRGSKQIPLKNICDEALAECPQVETLLVYKHTGGRVNTWNEGRDKWWNDEVAQFSTHCEAEIMDSEDPLFILYTSGSTGKPKGLLHTCAGYMVYAGYSFAQVFQSKNLDDVFWCTADIGWITGHTYLTYGPLLNGATVLMCEGIPTWPDAGRFWQICDKHQVTHFYTAPTAIRSLMGEGLKFVHAAKLTSLKVLGSVGEPINEEAWQWYNEHIGKNKCPIVDTWWQTETGGIMISSLAGVTEGVPSFATLPLPGIEPILVDEKGAVIPFVEGETSEGNLCLSKPWPSIARTIFGDHKRYQETYFSTYPGLYFTGDGAKRDGEGRFRITGRVDDVLNVSGHRLGTAELENAINEHPLVIESAVVGYPHDVKGQGIFAFVICDSAKKNTEPEKLVQEISLFTTKAIGAIAKPDKIVVVDGLPKTRSGKIMRRILRKIAEGNVGDIGDTSTLVDPNVVERILNNI